MTERVADAQVMMSNHVDAGTGSEASANVLRKTSTSSSSNFLTFS
jgi:hypothetical protein